MLYTCRVVEWVEREVLVDAPGERLAKWAAGQREQWLDAGSGVTVGVEVEHVQPHESMVDSMTAWKERVE